MVTAKLLYKLESYGVAGLLLKWIECFLSRIQCVVLDHTTLRLVRLSVAFRKALFWALYCSYCI
jgi:hypothetical protein